MRLVSLVTVFLGTLLSYSHLQAQNFSEILGRPTATSITMSILFDQKTEVFWEYGTNPGGYNSTTPVFIAAQDTTLMADFTGLFPDTKYYYRSRYRLSGTTNAYLAGAEHAFHTQRGAGSTFSFTIEADEHLYDKKGVRSIYQVTLANQAKDNPDFMLTLGDIFGDDHNPQTITSAQMKVLHKDYRQYLGQICHSVPLFICLGNHEGEKDYYLSQNPPDNMAVYATLWRKFYYANPYPGSFYTGNPDIEPYGMDHPENYYAWKWGDALFVVLDVYRDQCDTSAKPGSWNWSLGLPQYTWLKNTLESSTEQYKFVFAHHTRGEGRGGITTARYYEWGGYEADGVTWGFDNKRPGWGKPIHQLFVDNGVNIFFQGHDHLFAHEVLDGVTYQEVPMPSDSTYEIGMLANAGAYVSDTIGGTGHVRVTVSPSCIRADFIRAWLPADTLSGIHHNRETAFSYTIGSCSTQGIFATVKIPDILVSPNPANERFTIGLPGNQQLREIVVYNTLGRKLLQSESKTVDVTMLPAGIYFLNIRTSSCITNKKLIISR